MNENKKPVKRRRKKLKIGYVCACVLLLIVIIFGIKMVLPGSASKYGDRLDGIKKIKFGKEEQNKIVKKIKESDKVVDAKIEVKGKRIDVIYYVNKDASVDDAKNIGNSTLEVISDEVKNFYDIEYMVDKKGRDEKDHSFPNMGSKKNTSKGIVWIR